MKTRAQDNFSTCCLYRNLIAEGQKRDAASNFTTQAHDAEVKVEAMASQRLNAHFSPTTSATHHKHTYKHTRTHTYTFSYVCFFCICEKNRITNMFPLQDDGRRRRPTCWNHSRRSTHLVLIYFQFLIAIELLTCGLHNARPQPKMNRTGIELRTNNI